MSDFQKMVHQANMTEILKRLCQVSGMLETLSCMQGCTITPEMSSLLVATCEMFEDIVNDLMKMEGK